MAWRCARKGACWSAFLLILLASLGLPVGDKPQRSAAQTASAAHWYGLVTWEAANFPAKWLHRIYTATPWSDTGLAKRRADLERYLSLTADLRGEQGALDKASALSPADPAAVAAAQQAADALRRQRDALRDSVEEYLESAISAVIVEQGLHAGILVWPPVDFRLGQPPRVLVTSPRDRIERLETVLLSPQVPVAAMERIEQTLLEGEDLSAVVEPTGGLATFPTVIGHDKDLLPLLEVAAHEWLHAYLFFQPLGQAYQSGPDLITLNETVADIAGRELGRMAYVKVTGLHPPVLPPPATRPAVADAAAFDFFRFMRETRVRTEELLGAGDVAGAESYMEARRVELNSQSYSLRKINQAYFAFHGSYGESPSSVSPIAGELSELRALTGSAGNFVRAVRGVSTYEEFKALLAARRG